MSRQDCDTRSPRQAWIATLAKARADELENAWAALPAKPGYSFLRKPEFGLTMIRGRTGGTGAAFNLGEASSTRAAVKLDGKDVMGFGYVLGRDARRAELVAAFDALLQTGDSAAQSAVARLEDARRARDTADAKRTAASKVEFFAMTRE
jgi:alpha-D-ribose 1-methylphosphonate 5-triphosphate synthase subunit PhnG